MSPFVLLIGSRAFSLAFNISWAWGTHPLSVLAAAACTLIVPAGMHPWPQIPAHNGWVRLLRALVMSGICVAAAVTSFSHAVDVLTAAGWSPPTAWSVTGSAELLVALSTMAVRSPGRPVGTEGVRTSPAPNRVALSPTPALGTRQARVGDVVAVDHLDRAEAGATFAADQSAPGGSPAVDHPDDRSLTPVVDRAVLSELVADGAGRRRAARALNVSEYQASRLLAEARNGHRSNGAVQS